MLRPGSTPVMRAATWAPSGTLASEPRARARAKAPAVMLWPGPMPVRFEKTSGRWTCSSSTGVPRARTLPTATTSVASSGMTGSCSAVPLIGRRRDPSASTRTTSASETRPEIRPGSRPLTRFFESMPPPTTTPPGAPESALSISARRSPSCSEVTSGPILSASLRRIFVVGAARTFIPACLSSPATARIAPDLPPAPTKAATLPDEIPSASCSFKTTPVPAAADLVRLYSWYIKMPVGVLYGMLDTRRWCRIPRIALAGASRITPGAARVTRGCNRDQRKGE